MRDSLVLDRLDQGGAGKRSRAGHMQRCAAAKRHEHFRDAGIEAGGGELQHATVRADDEGVDLWQARLHSPACSTMTPLAVRWSEV